MVFLKEDLELAKERLKGEGWNDSVVVIEKLEEELNKKNYYIDKYIIRMIKTREKIRDLNSKLDKINLVINSKFAIKQIRKILNED
jgi:hypothetical protein